RRLADDRHIDVADRVSGFACQSDRALDEAARGRATPLGIARREVLADVARSDRPANGVDHGVERDVGIAVAGQPPFVLEPDSAEPQLLALDEAVHVVAVADARDGGGFHEILREGEFAQSLVAVDERDRNPCRPGDLRIVAGVGRSLPRPMRREDGLVPEGLRGLHATETVAVGLVRHLRAPSDCKAVDDGEDRNGRRLLRQGVEQALDDLRGAIRAGGIVDQHQLRCVAFERFEGCTDRSLAGRSTRNEANAGYPFEGFLRDAFGTLRYGNGQRPGTGRYQRFGGTPDDRLAAPQGELLGDWLPGTQSLAGSDNDGGEPCWRGSAHRAPGASALRSHPQSTMRCPIFRHTFP